MGGELILGLWLGLFAGIIGTYRAMKMDHLIDEFYTRIVLRDVWQE